MAEAVRIKRTTFCTDATIADLRRPGRTFQS
jgi:hypothetical protein